VDPQGRVHRAKVLSSSALRGTVAEVLGPDRLRVHTGWAAPAGFAHGFGFRLLGRDDPPVPVSAWDPEASVLGLGRPFAAAPEPGAAFEVLSPEEAPVLAARLLTGTPSGAPLPPLAMRLATTLGTNALLERRGVPTALVITRGFGDLLVIGDQQRPDLFALEIVKPEPLYSAVVEVAGRLDAAGHEIDPLDLEALDRDAARLAAEGIRAAAVAFLHAWRNPAHELAARDVLLARGIRHVSVSSELAPFLRLLPRAETAVVDAYLSPGVRRYLDRVREGASGARLHVMTSAGGLVDAPAFRAKDSLLSGPAGGVVGAARSGLQSGVGRLLAFDMGGTSTDVARIDGDFEYHYEHVVADARLLAPALAIESVAAGGGSVCWFDGDRLRVGPHSAGASPGPACYGAGGPLTLTDVNLLLGRLEPQRFGIPILPDAARGALDDLLADLSARTGRREKPEAILEGFLEVADERMADAMRRVSVRRGYDPADHALVAFGGAGGQHACAVASRLGVRTILVPLDAGLLSALGLGHAVVERFAERQVLRPLSEAAPDVAGLFGALAEEASASVAAEGVAAAEVLVRRRLAHLRFRGQDATVEVAWEPGLDLAEAFALRYAALYGHRPEGRAVELESLRVVACSRAEVVEAAPAAAEAYEAEPGYRRRARFGGRSRRTGVHHREHLRPGAWLEGPALVFEAHGAVAVEPGWWAEVDGAGSLVLRRSSGAAAGAGRRRPEAVRLELFTNRFRAVVHEMGEQLRRTAVSTNVKERLDFSCALLDPRGELVVNAPHIPVHLGGLGLCVRRVAEALDLRPGDVAVTNHPGFGGSHLPDVTVITPVYQDPVPRPDPERASARRRRPALLGYVASRAHHAEIGGSRPGSMPPAATALAEEGVLIPPMRLLDRGEGRWDAVRALLEAPPFPSRAVEDNLADLRAAVAANHAGAEALRALAGAHGAATVRRYMRALTRLAERRIREAFARIPDGRYEALERLDDGSALSVRVEVAGERATVDFSGSAGVHPGNLNATPAIVRSVVLYVLRLLLRDPLPLNEGLLRAVDLRIPVGILDPQFPDDPRQAPAVVGGNVETSQRLVDALVRALGLAACSQGTMNNVLFGDGRFGYYETVCGGAGAGPGFHGASAVHTHMTNTRITDPEVIEHRYPVRVERFAVRRGSGGSGRWRGGDGVVRELTFLAPVSLSLLTQHRVEQPYGLEGGSGGACGRQRLIRASGDTVELGHVDGAEVRPGDRLVLETPGGGGYGPPGEPE
jgi:5-oxoprolinase (ATP-hydrolysing)